MKKLLLAAGAALLLPLASCSDDDGGGGGSSGGGEGGSAPRPSGAVAMEVYATMEQTCPAGNVHVNIGHVQSAPPALVVDGEEGAAVSCSVVPSGDKLEASGAIEQGPLAFSFGGLITDGTSAVGEVTFRDPATGVRYASPAASPCVFQFAPNTDQGVSAGWIWVQFDCSALVSEADPAASCSSRYGYVLLENCAGGAP
jgi:hypothetical protein